jgi:hypothetical protein
MAGLVHPELGPRPLHAEQHAARSLPANPVGVFAVSALGLVVALAIMLRDGGTANIIAAVASAVLSGFLLDERGVIRWVYRPDTYRMRASVDEIVAVIDALPAA